MTIKAKAEVDVCIPANVILYDVGGETVECRLCGKRESCELYPPQDHDAGDLMTRLLRFVKEHAGCVLKRGQ